MTTMMETLQPPFQLMVGTVSEKGAHHALNEDSYRVDVQRGLFILADGMGGHRAGEVASRTAVEVIYETLTTTRAGSLEEALGTALLMAHQVIREMARENEEYRGMGTTALIGWVRVPNLVLWVGHVGNSRAYLWRDGALQRLTEDQTLLNELKRSNLLPSELRDWPSPALLSQALGSPMPYLAPELGEWPLQIGDRLLFCSDGVFNALASEDISEILSRSRQPQVACTQLAQAIRHRGAPDDFTAIAVYIEARRKPTLRALLRNQEVQR